MPLNSDYSGVVSLETHYVPLSGSKEEGARESFKGIVGILSELGLLIRCLI